MPVITLTVLGLSVLGTVAILALPDLRFAARMPRTRLAVESIAAAVALLVAALWYLRYALGGIRSWLWLSVAFLILGGNQLVFGVLVDPARIGSEQASYFWTTGRLLVGVLLLVASLPRTRSTRDAGGQFRRFAVLTGASIATLTLVQTMLWMQRASLPPMTSLPEAVASSTSEALPGLSAMALCLGISGAVLYLTATAGFLREGDRPAPPWLPPALALAAVSHLHHMLFPSVFTDWVTTGDLLRALFGVTLLGGLLWEVRARFVAERDRSVELRAAYRRERARVEELEVLDRAKARFLSIMTHELMQPVAALRGFVATLRARWRDLDAATRDDILERLEVQSKSLRDMAEGAATGMHLEEESFSILPQPMAASEIVQEAAIAPAELSGRLTVTFDPALEDATVEVDLGRILQVLRNLLTNAAKYTDPESGVELRGEVRDGSVVFIVSDQGPGLSSSDVPKIFRRFSRVRPSGKEHVGGSGLGLYIARRIAEAHGGTLEVKSTPGVGSRFLLTLPIGDSS